MHILLAIFVILSFSCSQATNTLSHSHVFVGKETLVSANGMFVLGFFKMSSKPFNYDSPNMYLGIWFSKVPKLTPVWTANRGNPISSLTSPHLMISGDGNLVILAQGTVVWSTQANITTSNTTAVLLDNGNFVLRSSSNTSQLFWQSFDHLTDTCMPESKIGENKITGLKWRLVSRKNSVDQAPGAYSMELSADGIIRSFWNSSKVYWSSGAWNGRFFSSMPDMAAGQSGLFQTKYTFVNDDKEVFYSFRYSNKTIVIHNFLHVSGQSKSLLWLNQDWVTLNVYPKSQCDVYATCGPFTICTDNANQVCNCMEGFSVRSPKDWVLEDTSGGCIRNNPLNCHGSGDTDKFYSIPSIRLPVNGKGLNATTAKKCAEACLHNCSCTAYSYGKGGCSIWHDELLNVAADANGEILYLRLAAKEAQSRWRSNRVGIIVGIAISTFCLVFICLIVIWRRRTGKRRSHTMDDHGSIGVIAFRYADLKHATKNFSEQLGRGGFGSVFKGFLSDTIGIAVKRLEGTRQGEKQFRAEVSSIGIIQHINLVRLIGFCCEGDKRLLVYELVENCSLDFHLFQCHGIVLDWNLRYHIALGVARGLAYLHHSCQDCIIHCDIKPQNILLDTCFIPKIADFGMSKFVGRNFSHVVTTLRGTIGYLAPEWIGGAPITSKVDVYSYGMVLLEIVSGKRNSGNKSLSDDDHHVGYFPVQVVRKLLDGDVADLVDKNLLGNVNLDEVERVCKVACWCIQDNESDRPTMTEVVQLLEGVVEPEMPPMPRLLHAIAGLQ